MNNNSNQQTEVIVSVPRKYAEANESKEPDYWDYKNYQIKFNEPEGYELIKKIGRGKYSEVYEGIDSSNDNRIVVKILKPVKDEKYKREIKILEAVNGCVNVIKLLDKVYDAPSQTPALIMEFVDTKDEDFRELYSKFTDLDIRYYMYEILRGLDDCHSRGIMHRDIKPHNIMIDHENKKLRIIDWGLAEFYHRGEEYNVRVASRYFKGPELLVGYRTYDYSLDMWSLGCMFAGMIFQREPFFKGKSNPDQLVKIARILGTSDLHRYLMKYGIILDDDYMEEIGSHERKDWSKFINAKNKSLCSKEALEFLSNLLVYDHSRRILPCEAMELDYFKPVRKYYQEDSMST